MEVYCACNPPGAKSSCRSDLKAEEVGGFVSYIMQSIEIQ